MDVKTLVDAGPLVAWLNAADQWHKWTIVTVDSGDFRLYRRFRREPLPVIPP
jgi:hypothetical protein